MPYIFPERRAIIQDSDFNKDVLRDGDINFLVTQLVDGYIQARGLSYNTLNTMIGVLECAKLELYRRLVGPYEDLKIQQNGDVYSEKLTALL